jgi:hypothetical protein
MNLPGFTAGSSLYPTRERYHGGQTTTAADARVVPQLNCPQGLLNKASGLCHDPKSDDFWCGILRRCLSGIPPGTFRAA